MITWFRTNTIGFLLGLLAAALILVTVTWPSREDSLGFREPVATAPPDVQLDVEGMRWSMRHVRPDVSDPDVTLTYLVTVSGNPPPDPPLCAPVLTDGVRRWSPVVAFGPTRSWAYDQGYSGYCQFEKSFALSFKPPEGTRPTAVDLMLSPLPEGDATVAESRGWVIRFLTG